MGGCARRTQGKIYEQHVMSRVSGVSHSDLFNAVRSDFTHFEQVGPQLNRHTRYRPATTTRNTATQRSRRSMD